MDCAAKHSEHSEHCAFVTGCPQHAAGRLAAAGSCAMVRDGEGKQCCLRGRLKSLLTESGDSDGGLQLSGIELLASQVTLSPPPHRCAPSPHAAALYKGPLPPPREPLSRAPESCCRVCGCVGVCGWVWVNTAVRHVTCGRRGAVHQTAAGGGPGGGDSH